MNKKGKIALIVLASIIIIGNIVDFAFAVSNENATIHWNYYLIAFAVLIAIPLIRVIVVRNKIKRLKTAYENKDYAKVLEMKRTANIVGLSREQREMIFLAEAVANLEVGDLTEFYCYMNKVNCDRLKNQKLMWQAIYSFSKHDMEVFFSIEEAIKENQIETYKQKALDVLRLLVNVYENKALSEEEQALATSLHSDFFLKLIGE